MSGEREGGGPQKQTALTLLGGRGRRRRRRTYYIRDGRAEKGGGHSKKEKTFKHSHIEGTIVPKGCCGERGGGNLMVMQGP